MKELLRDPFGRQFQYLRLSVTETCNFKCSYCLPNGYKPSGCGESQLSLAEIKNLVSGFAAMGFKKVRITGGEPTVRRDIVEIVRAIAQTPGIETVAMSTNAWRLSSLVPSLQEAGLNALNVSIDSLNPETFKTITGEDKLGDILKGLDLVLERGFAKVKINAVFLKGLNDHELGMFQEFVRHRPLAVRFIELMRTGDNTEYFKKHWISGEELQRRLSTEGWNEQPRKTTDGPAREFSHPDFAGRIGIIAPYSKDFCASCNRLRVSSRGSLKLCLFGQGSLSLRENLQSPSQQEALITQVKSLLGLKPASHYLQEGNYGTTRNLASIGG